MMCGLLVDMSYERIQSFKVDKKSTVKLLFIFFVLFYIFLSSSKATLPKITVEKWKILKNPLVPSSAICVCIP